MIPVDLDPANLQVGLVARGKALARRLRFLRRGGIQRVKVFSDKPGEVLAERLGDKIIDHLPSGDDLKGMKLLFIAGLEPEENEQLVMMARRRRILVNCEDVKDKCDFHVPAVVRRGDLTVAISTGGKSPGLAKRLRVYLSEVFGEEWKDRLEEIAKAREVWKQNGANLQELNQMTNAMIEEKNWLP